MSTALLKRMAADALRLLGEPAVFEGTPTRIHIEHGVQLTGIDAEQAAYRGDYVANRDVASVSCELNPKTGDRFTQGNTMYRLERVVDDNNFIKRFVVLRVPLPTAQADFAASYSIES